MHTAPAPWDPYRRAAVAKVAIETDTPQPSPFYTTLTRPRRLLDTRTPGGTTIDGLHAATGHLSANTPYQLPIGGRGGIPVSAGTVVLNATAVGPTSAGYLTVYPCGSPVPNASNLNFGPGEIIANTVITRLSTSGTVCLFSSTHTDLIVDASGYFPEVTAMTALDAPARLLDTRKPGGTTVDRQHAAIGPIATDATYQVNISGRAGIPTAAITAALNVTAVAPSGPGFITVYPCGTPRPNASNLNYVGGQIIANTVISRLETNGTICIYTSIATDLIVDAQAYSANPRAITPLSSPARLLDTRRPGGTTVDNQHAATGAIAAAGTYRLSTTGRAGIPSNAAAVTLNVTVVNPTAPGYITIYPCGAPLPNASNLNYAAGQIIANAVITRPSASGETCIYSSASTDVIVDAAAYTP